MLRFFRCTCFIASFLFTIVSQQLTPPAFADAATCHNQTILVTLSPTDPTLYHVATWLCWQGNLQGKTVQLLLHGLTYDHTYWDFPYQQPMYSYLSNAMDAGYAVLNMDRIGAGQSDHPLDALVTLRSGAWVTHQLVQDLRTGMFENVAVPKIVLVGHSAGSGIAILEASSYQDVDGVLLSGYAHVLNPAAATLISSDFYPAFLDPKFANSGYSSGYITTKPNTRGQLFYDLANSDPNVIALDESLKQAGTSEELTDLPLTILPSVSMTIHVPILIADGQFDQLLCGVGAPCDNSAVLLAREQAFFDQHACLEAFILPNSGHDLNLHLNAADWYAIAQDWANRRIGNSPENPASQPCS